MYVLKGKGYCPTVADVKGTSGDYAQARCMLITHSVTGDMINGIDRDQPVKPGQTVLYQDHSKQEVQIVIESVVFGYMYGLSPGFCMIQFRLVEEMKYAGSTGTGSVNRKPSDAPFNSCPNAPYGYCPQCGEPGRERERGLNGNDTCVNGHSYPSREALDQKP